MDHRTRTGAQRREKMRQRLVESALTVIAEAGIAGTTIDSVIRTAGVSRGSFYNYFQSTEELIQATSDDLKGEMLLRIAEAASDQDSPAARIAAGFATFLATIAAYPQLARFVQALDLGRMGPAKAVMERFPVFLRHGIAAGQFAEQPPEVMIDLITGCLVKGAGRIVSGDVDAVYARHLTAGVLRGLGLQPEAAWQIASVQVSPITLPEDGLLGHLHRIGLGGKAL